MHITKNKERLIYILLCAALWTYLFFRAVYVPIVNDEAVSFFYFIQPGRFLPFYSNLDANNHFLNSALSFCFYRLFGNSEFVLRLPNLLSAMVYFFFIYKLSGMTKRPIIRWAFIVTLLSANFILDFFALCRGYGISIALLMAAIWYFAKYVKENRTAHLVTYLLLFFLALSANMNLLVSNVISAAITSLNILISRISYKRKLFHLSILLALGIIPVFFAVKLLLIMKAKGLLYAGGDVGFIHDTVCSLSSAFTNYTGPFLTMLIITLFILISIFLARAWILRQHLENFNTVGFLLYCLLAGNIVTSIAMHQLFGINYLSDRTAIFYFPLFVGSFYFMLDLFSGEKIFHYLLLFCLPFLFFPFHFLRNANIEHIEYWKNDQFPLKLYDKVASSYNNYTNGFPPMVSAHPLNSMCWYYYNYKKNGCCSEVQTEEFPCSDADFIIVNKPEAQKLLRQYDSVDGYDYTQLYLLKRKESCTRMLIDSIANLNTPGIVDSEVFSIWSEKADSFKNKSLFIGFKMSLFSETAPFKAHIIFSASDKNGNNLIYNIIELAWLKKQWNGEQNNLVNSIYMYKVPEDACSIKVFLWNINKTPFSISKGSCYIYVLE